MELLLLEVLSTKLDDVKLLDVTEEVISEDSDNGLEQGKTGSIESITISQH